MSKKPIRKQRRPWIVSASIVAPIFGWIFAILIEVGQLGLPLQLYLVFSAVAFFIFVFMLREAIIHSDLLHGTRRKVDEIEKGQKSLAKGIKDLVGDRRTPDPDTGPAGPARRPRRPVGEVEIPKGERLRRWGP